MHHDDAMLEIIAVAAALSGIVAAVAIYMTGKDQLAFAKQMLAPIYEALFNKYYVDEIYDFLIVKPVKGIGKFMEERAEKLGIDFSVDEVGRQVHEVSRGISIWQLLIILVIVVLLFGTKKLRNIGSDLGGAIKSFRKSMKEGEEKENETPEQEQLEDKAEATAQDASFSEKDKA